MNEQSGDPIVVEVDADLEALVPRYLENRRGELETFREALAVGDLETLASMGHKLKGTGGGYGFDELTAIGGEIEDRAAAGDLDSVDTAVQRLMDFLDRVRVEYV